MGQKAARLALKKNIIYTFLLLLAYLLQEIPAFLPEAIRPVLVIAVVAAVAIHEGEFAGGLFGAFGGLLCDTSAFHIFGVATIFFLILGCACGLVIIYLIQPGNKSAFLLTGGFALIYGLVVFYLVYGMWGYEGAWVLLLRRTLPSALSTAVCGVLAYRLVGGIRVHFEEAARE